MTESSKAAILVVDDTRVNRIVLENRLKENGYEVTSAEDGREALEMLNEVSEEPAEVNGNRCRFDAVILDIMMPEVDGIEVLTILRRSYSSIDLPVIMATAKDQSEDVVEALRAGANDYVTKPVDIPALVARLETQLALKHSHQSLKDAQRSLIHAAKMESIGYLAAGVAHEIRNPLAQMQLASDGLANLEEVQENESAKTLSDLMSDAIERADTVVKRLMEFSASARLDLKPGSLNQLVSETLEIMAFDIGNAGVELKTEFDPDLESIPFATEELQQVLINIIVNALQAMEDGGGKLHIRTSELTIDGLPADEGSRSGNRLRNGDVVQCLEVEDSGPGIPAEDLNSLFDAFFTSKPTGEGTGLGLTVAKKVVDLHGGLIEVGNRENESGVRVRISLPVDVMSTTV